MERDAANQAILECQVSEYAWSAPFVRQVAHASTSGDGQLNCSLVHPAHRNGGFNQLSQRDNDSRDFVEHDPPNGRQFFIAHIRQVPFAETQPLRRARLLRFPNQISEVTDLGLGALMTPERKEVGPVGRGDHNAYVAVLLNEAIDELLVRA